MLCDIEPAHGELRVGTVFQDQEKVIVELTVPSFEVQTIAAGSGKQSVLKLMEIMPDGQTDPVISQYVNRLLYTPDQYGDRSFSGQDYKLRSVFLRYLDTRAYCSQKNRGRIFP
jgi:hypothetical protein